MDIFTDDFCYSIFYGLIVEGSRFSLTIFRSLNISQFESNFLLSLYLSKVCLTFFTVLLYSTLLEDFLHKVFLVLVWLFLMCLKFWLSFVLRPFVLPVRAVCVKSSFLFLQVLFHWFFHSRYPFSRLVCGGVSSIWLPFVRIWVLFYEL